MDTEELYTLIKDGTSDRLIEVVNGWPATPMSASALSLLESDETTMRIIALSSLCNHYCYGRAPELGAMLAAALHRLASELYDAGNRDIIATTMSGLALLHLTALNQIGDSAAVVEQAPAYIERYRELDERENLPGLSVAYAAALVDLDRIDEAESIVEDPALLGNWSTDIEVKRLRSKIATLKSGFTQTAPTSNRFDTREELLRAVSGALKNSGNLGSAEMDDLIQSLGQSPELDPNSEQGFNQLTELLRRGTEFLSAGVAEETEWTINQKIRDATGIFLAASQSREQLEDSLEALTAAVAWARDNDKPDIENDALWGVYLCNSRLDHPDDAANALERIRQNAEARRAGIENPEERGGAFTTFPHLFQASVTQLYKADRHAELFDVIEASKSQGIADLLTEKAGIPVADRALYAQLETVRKLTVEHEFHYLSYFVDEDRTYAILVTREGKLVAIEPVEIAAQTLRRHSRNIDPGRWGKRTATGRVIDNATQGLAAISTCLEKLVDDGTIRPGDHIVYSADESISNIPLHILPLFDKPLIATLSVSKIHGAYHLVSLLGKEAAGPPLGCTAFTVGLANDSAEMLESFNRPIAFLREHGIECAGLDDLGVTRDAILSATGQSRLLHFSTHGYFPERSGDNPFDGSGLMVSDGSRLPTIKDAFAGSNFLFTPRDLFQSSTELDGSHVTLMACVSGLSREGIAGDALGLEWAFIQSGAVSMLATHWKVSAALALTFICEFYDRWIVQKQPKLVAYRDSVLECGGNRADWNTADAWAAFGFIGDWR